MLKSKNIEIHVDNGEEFKIVITDDGIGIQEEDLQLCVQRHATSKISNNDLSKIQTLRLQRRGTYMLLLQFLD